MRKLHWFIIVLAALIFVFTSLNFFLFPKTPRQSPPEFIKGIWMPVPFAALTYGFNTMKEDGINTFGTQLTYYYKDDGAFSWHPFFYLFNKVTLFDLKLAKRAGLKTWLVLVALEKIGEPQPIKAEILKNPDFLKNYNKKIIEAAKLAEEYQIDFFSPYDEPDYRVCADYFRENDEEIKDICSTWIHDIIPKIKEVYHGRIIFKSALNQGYNYSFINVSNYDYLGVTISMAPDEKAQKEQTNKILDAALNLTKGTDTVVLVTEFGAWGEAIKMPEKDKVERETIILEELKDKVEGICIGNYSEPGGSIKNTPQEELIKKYFTQVIKK